MELLIGMHKQGTPFTNIDQLGIRHTINWIHWYTWVYLPIWSYFIGVKTPVAVSRWMSNYIPHKCMDVISNPCNNRRSTMSLKGTQGVLQHRFVSKLRRILSELLLWIRVICLHIFLKYASLALCIFVKYPMSPSINQYLSNVAIILNAYFPFTYSFVKI